MLVLLAIAASIAVALALISFTAGRRTSFELGFQTGYRVQRRGWWLWESFDLYDTVQYTYRGVPVGAPTEHLVTSVKEVNPEAIAEVLRIAGAVALQSPVPLLEAGPSRRAPLGLPEGLPAAAWTHAGARRRA